MIRYILAYFWQKTLKNSWVGWDLGVEGHKFKVNAPALLIVNG